MNNLTPNYKTLTRIPLFRRAVLQSFPFIEEDFDALTDYELLCKVVEYLNNVIKQQNLVGENTDELLRVYLELKNYVDGYLNDETLQPLINNKLDEMTSDGTLLNILSNYTNIERVYPTHADLVLDTSNLVNNMKVKTLGYYTLGDGGNAEYIVKTSEPSNTYYEQLDTNLYIEMIIKNNTINFLSIGGRKQDTSNNLYDNKTILEKYITLINNTNYLIKLYIPGGIYGFSETNIINNKGFEIYGDYSMPQWLWTNTIFVPYLDNQNYIIKIGTTSTQSLSCNLKDITFSSAYFEYDSTNKAFKVQSTNNSTILESNLKKINGYALDIFHTMFSRFPNLDFRYIKGGCLQIGSSWEIDIHKINIRNVWNLTSNLINFDENSSSIQYANITACNFDEIYVEAVTGDVINIESNCSFANNKIGLINFEPKTVEFYGDINVNLSDSFISEYTKMSLIKINDNAQCNDVMFNNIQINNMPWIVTTYNYINYIYDTIISFGKGSKIAPIFNNISVIGQRKDINVLYYTSNETNPVQNMTINNFQNYDLNYKGILNVNKIYNISVNNFINQYTNTKINNTLMKSCYKDNYISPSRHFGNITYDPDALNSEKLCVNFIDRVTNPAINNVEIRGILPKCSKFHIRVKAPNEKTGNLSFVIADKNDTTLGSTFKSITGDGTFQWVTFNVAGIENIDYDQDLYYKISPGTTVDFEFLADIMYTE